MATDWQGLAVQQAELISSRVREVLSLGVKFLKTELGVEIDVKPELCPSWIILSTVFIGLFVVAVLTWVAACSVGRKRRPIVSESNVSDVVEASVTKIIKTEEPKKKNKKKSIDKKPQPNGRTASEPPEEVKAAEDIPKPQTESKFDKVKKNKKKAKLEVKPTQAPLPSPEGKEPDEGNWETKVSNKERRQQRKKEKGPNDESPRGGDRSGHQGELATAAPTAFSGSRKNRDSAHAKAGKADSAVGQAPGTWTEVPSVNSRGWTDPTLKLGSAVSPSDSEKWSPMMKPSGHRNPEPLVWTQETDGGSWSSMDGRMKSELNPVNYVLGLNSGGEPMSQPAADLQWDSLASVDEWSSFNGLAAVDPTSDWNAPTELWGNYEEPAVDITAPAAAPVSQQSIDSDDDKEKGDGGIAKSKKKKKKKKKQDEGDGSEMESGSSKPQAYAAMGEPGPGKQSTPPPAVQKKMEQNTEVPKQKKKARRET
ncbi:metadherin a isoform X2 [Alosa sapidissima]|uniref:metadherin a isoform X2 n=1 Tax=Alosa sapidissima TaxID=34773 RepID=UPI001C084243|nr:metadherin a isoform X2 [Alosa sapidissima]